METKTTEDDYTINILDEDHGLPAAPPTSLAPHVGGEAANEVTTFRLHYLIIQR